MPCAWPGRPGGPAPAAAPQAPGRGCQVNRWVDGRTDGRGAHPIPSHLLTTPKPAGAGHVEVPREEAWPAWCPGTGTSRRSGSQGHKGRTSCWQRDATACSAPPTWRWCGTFPPGRPAGAHVQPRTHHGDARSYSAFFCHSAKAARELIREWVCCVPVRPYSIRALGPESHVIYSSLDFPQLLKKT